MPEHARLRGELQIQIMSALWRIDSGGVEEVRMAMPARYHSAYNTVQTVLNRLTDRGLLRRTRTGNSFGYRPSMNAWSM